MICLRSLDCRAQSKTSGHRSSADLGRVIVSADGSILTNHHVVDGADKITVMTSDNIFRRKDRRIGQTERPCVIKIEGKDLLFFPGQFGPTSGRLVLGDLAIAGNGKPLPRHYVQPKAADGLRLGKKR